MRLGALTVRSLSQRTSMIQGDQVMSAFTHSGPIAARHDNQKSASAVIGARCCLLDSWEGVLPDMAASVISRGIQALGHQVLAKNHSASQIFHPSIPVAQRLMY